MDSADGGVECVADAANAVASASAIAALLDYVGIAVADAAAAVEAFADAD